jgi:hypothetical protein
LRSRVSTGGYAAIESVATLPVHHLDKMESFWLSETLKYLWLLVSDDSALPLDEWILNTEAHPLPVLGGRPQSRWRPKRVHGEQNPSRHSGLQQA